MCYMVCQCCHPLRRWVAQAAQAGVCEANGTIRISLRPGTSAWVERTASSQLWRLPGLIVTCLRSLGGPWEAGQGTRDTWLSPAHHSQASWNCLCTLLWPASTHSLPSHSVSPRPREKRPERPMTTPSGPAGHTTRVPVSPPRVHSHDSTPQTQAAVFPSPPCPPLAA